MRRNGKHIAGSVQSLIALQVPISSKNTLARPVWIGSRNTSVSSTKASNHHIRLGVCTVAGQTAGVGTNVVLHHACAFHTVREGTLLRERAERFRTPLFELGRVSGEMSPIEQNRLKAEAAKLGEVFQRSSSNAEGRSRCLSLRNHALRGLNHPRKQVCLTAMHNFFLALADSTRAGERFCGQKPRSMCAVVLISVAYLQRLSVHCSEVWARLERSTVADAMT